MDSTKLTSWVPEAVQTITDDATRNDIGKHTQPEPFGQRIVKTKPYRDSIKIHRPVRVEILVGGKPIYGASGSELMNIQIRVTPTERKTAITTDLAMVTVAGNVQSVTTNSGIVRVEGSCAKAHSESGIVLGGVVSKQSTNGGMCIDLGGAPVLGPVPAPPPPPMRPVLPLSARIEALLRGKLPAATATAPAVSDTKSAVTAQSLPAPKRARVADT